MRHTSILLALAATATLTTAALTAATGGAVGAPAHHDRSVAKGGPGSWTKISKSTVGITYRASMTRTANGILHVVYPHDLSGGGTTIGHTALNTDGSTAAQNNLFATGWSTMDVSPIVVSEGGTSLRTMFVGQKDLGSGTWSQNQMYTATSGDSGGSWALPADTIGGDNNLSGLYGMGATTLADGTPVAATPLNGDLRWHVGTGLGADQTYTSPAGGSIYDVTLVRSGSAVWASWFQSGGTPSTHGTFAMQIYPPVGTPLQAPGSSSNAQSISTGRTALAARVGGGVYLAYCVGYPSCTSVRVWKVGSSTWATVPHTKFATTVALSAGPTGRLWVAWSDNGPKVHAVRTGVNGLAMGAVRTPGIPRGQTAIYNVAIEGSRGRGDIVVNVGDAFWHTQVLAGLTLHASPSKWRHGSRQRVVFTVTDAHSAVGGATVKVGTRHCSTGTHGTCAITFPGSFSTGRHAASAGKSGYAKATTTLRVS